MSKCFFVLLWTPKHVCSHSIDCHVRLYVDDTIERVYVSWFVIRTPTQFLLIECYGIFYVNDSIELVYLTGCVMFTLKYLFLSIECNARLYANDTSKIVYLARFVICTLKQFLSQV